MKNTLTIFAALLLSATVWAQSPQKMSYQAVIRNSSEQLVINKKIGMQISILQGSETGTVVYSETQTPKTNANGLVSIEIGNKAGFDAIYWANGPYFIKTETDPAGGTNYTITGTSELLSVPFALYSLNGTPGLQGIQGEKGDQGIQGEQGIKGDTGIQGETGAKGDKGDQGIQGATGLTGAKGDTGDIGTKGDKGDTGAAGSDGLTTSVNGVTQVSGSITLTTANIPISADKRYVTDAQLVVLGNTSNTNTGDETNATIKTKLGITTISGNNTGDQILPTLESLGAVAGNAAISGATKTKITYDSKGLVIAGVDATTADIVAAVDKNYVTNAQLVVIGNTSGTNTGDQDLSSFATTASVNLKVDKVAGKDLISNGTAIGQMNYWNGTTWVTVSPGTTGQNLTYCYGVPTWGACPVLPSITTNIITAIAYNGATSGGNVTNDGGGAIIARGICWSTSINPTLSNSFSNNGPGSGSFTSSLTGLIGSTTYYVRAYATNIAGTTYGNEESFTTAAAPAFDEVTNPTTGKTWMDRNLGATQVATSSTDAASYGDLYQWGRGTDGHQLRTSNITHTCSSTDSPGNSDFIDCTSGNFDWRSPQNDNLWQGVGGINNPCPSGFRIPTETELAEEKDSWITQNAAGAFASSIKLPQAGFRFSNGDLGYVGISGRYWYSSLHGTNSGSLNVTDDNASLYQLNRNFGLSVRCIKN